MMIRYWVVIRFFYRKCLRRVGVGTDGMFIMVCIACLMFVSSQCGLTLRKVGARMRR